MITQGIEPYHWAIAGLALGLTTVALLALANKRFGISTGFENVCSLVLRAPYFRRRKIVDSNRWRLPFMGGLVIGGVLSSLVGGGWTTTWDLGMWDTVIGGSEGVKVLWMFAGGALIGFGTRLAGGCTSGHAVFGLSNFEPAGLAATLSFMGAGVVTTNLLYRVFTAGV